jgi:hypothetical protein
MITIHIGLAKCASTSLQRYVFPEMEKINNNIEFNNKKLFELSRNHHLFPLSTKEKKIFNEILQNGKDHLISNESLINWDPVYHKEAAELNLELFGRKANVIIVVRDSMEYFTSIYQQKIHEGNIISADKFFVKQDMYNKLKTISYQKCVLQFFNQKEFSLEKIYNIYNKRFDSVFFVPLSKINDLLFLKEIYNLTDDEIEGLKIKLSSAPRANKAYSSFAMKLTFKREKILNLFGLKSYGSWDYSPLSKLPMPLKASPQKQSNLSMLGKVRGYLIRVRNRLRWRALMQLLVNKYLPYAKYKLPKGLPILQENLNNDSVFLKKIEKDYYVLPKVKHNKVN